MKELQPWPFSKHGFGGGSGAQVHFHKEKSSEMKKNPISVLKIYERLGFVIKLVPYSKQQKKITDML